MSFGIICCTIETKTAWNTHGSFREKSYRQQDSWPRFRSWAFLRRETLMGKYGFRALFVEQYVCVYRIEEDAVRIYHFADARKKYIYHIFGVE